MAERIEYVANGERSPVGHRQRFRHAHRAPDQRHHAIQHQHDEDAAPLRQQQYGLAEGRRNDGHGDEYHHRQRHHARHAPSGVAVAHDRGGDHARRRGADALQRTRQQQRLERGRGDRQHARHRIDRHAAEQHRAAAEAVRQRAQDRREGELPQRPRGAEVAEDLGRARGVAAQHGLDQLGQHGDDDAERDDVEQHDGEDEG